jgi:putative glutathione S-transferase
MRYQTKLINLLSFTNGKAHYTYSHSPLRIRVLTTRNQTLKMSTNTATDKKGAYERNASKHQHIIKEGGEFPPESDRYHLHIALACPWATGVLAMLHLKGLEDVISHSIVHPTWGKTKPNDPSDKHHGWVYRKPGDEPMSNPLGHGSYPCDDALIPDPSTNANSVREVFELDGDMEGPFTTPLLFDKKNKTIVCNESTKILRMLNDDFNDFAKNPDLNLYPKDKILSTQLDNLNDTLVYPKVNNGVYRCGFARSQEAYNEAVTELFESLDTLEDILENQRYLGGKEFTWLDLRLYMTMVRFDPVYVTYFKTNKKRIVDYPNLLGFVRDVYSMESVKKVTNMDHIKTHYFTSHPVHNTFGIIPIYDGPDLDVAHGREGKVCFNPLGFFK